VGREKRRTHLAPRARAWARRTLTDRQSGRLELHSAVWVAAPELRPLYIGLMQQSNQPR